MVEEIIEHSFAAWPGIQRLRIEPKPKPSNNTRNKINLRLCCLVRYNETFSGVRRQSIDGTQKMIILNKSSGFGIRINNEKPTFQFLLQKI